jgi:hypothetical protein
MEVNIAARSFVIIFHTMGFIERRQFQKHHKKMVCRKDEKDNRGAYKEYEITCWFDLTVLGRCCRHLFLLNKQRTFKLFGWLNSRGGMDRKKGKLFFFENFRL